jgi:hypothetical protein
LTGSAASHIPNTQISTPEARLPKGLILPMAAQTVNFHPPPDQLSTLNLV